MHLHFEKSINAKCDCSILSMSWMGKVPEELPEEEGWKLNRTHYYQEGWLATGNQRGIVGVTFTSSHWRKAANGNGQGNGSATAGFSADLPQRTNYNLRGHRSQITLVQWNEPYQKLASCDSSGIIFVWIKFEGRWSIELINDRSTPVTHFSWSHDGRMALICYRDGFVLVGSVAGQRYWSSMLNLNAIITCGLWSPSDQQVFLGTSNAQVIVMDVVHGMMISQVQMPMDSPIISMTWSCEKFKMEETEEVVESASSPGFSNPNPSSSSSQQQQQQQAAQEQQLKRPLVLAIAFQNGLVFLMKNYDDIAPIQIYTGMQQGLMMEWSNSGEFLAVVGTRPVEIINEFGAKIHEYFSSLHFYNHSGVRVLNIVIPSTQWPVTALTWGHNDKRLFVATGQTIHVGWVAKKVASLQLLCRLTIYKALSNENCVSHLPLPIPVRTLISSLHTQTILSILPNGKDLLEFCSHPPYNNGRLHCTMIRHDEIWSQSPGTVYTLYLEYLGGLIPILKGKRTSKIRPQFVIFSPQGTADGTPTTFAKLKSEQELGKTKGDFTSTSTPIPSKRSSRSDNSCPFQPILSDSSDSEDVELCASPRMQRKRHQARLRERERERRRERELEWERGRGGGSNNLLGGQQDVPPADSSSTLHLNNEHPTTQQQSTQQLAYNDVLPENLKLVEVTSNIWGTKFKIHGLESFPPNLGSLSYKTSVLHLQPRQMTCIITELTDDIFLNSTSTNGSEHNVTSHSSQPQTQTQQLMLDEVDDMFSVVVGSSNSTSSTTCTTSNYYTSSIDRGVSSRDEYNMSSRYSKTTTTTSRQDECPYVEALSEYSTSETTTTPIPSCSATSRSSRHLVTHAALIERIDEASSSSSSTAICQSVPGPSILSHKGSVHSSPTRRRISWTKLQQQSSAEGCSGSSGGRLVGATGSNNNSSPPPVQPIHVRRSISASYLDHVFERTLPAPVDMVSPDLMNPNNSPPKRLVLVKENQLKEAAAEEEEEAAAAAAAETLTLTTRKPINWLKDCGKSKSWDFAELAKLKQSKTNHAICNLRKHPCCPTCKFPTTTTTNKSGTPLKPWSPAKTLSTSRPAAVPSFPKTPARKLSSTMTIPKTPSNSAATARRRDSNEDRIERLAESPPPLLPSPPPTPPPSSTNVIPQTPKLTRRFSNFLTPLLRRRDFFSSSSSTAAAAGASNSNSGDKDKDNDKDRRSKPAGNPNSTCYIPPDSPTHIAHPMSNPTTPAGQRRLKIRHQSYLAAASSPFRQLWANSPLLSRRKCNNNSLPTNVKSGAGSGSGSGSSSALTYRRHHHQQQHHHHHHTIIDSTDDEDEDDDELSSSSRHGSKSFTRGCTWRTPAQFPSLSCNRSSSPSMPPPTQAHHNNASGTFRDLETFQKSQLRQKLRKKKIHNIDNSPVRPKRREFVLHNKAPMWNENSQVYQLDFGGRVTQESAKNFQIEFRGKQVMQFGRIDSSAYTLDFQYPFSALQAFGVALGNVTQRLK